jgi:hypothetical protein
MSMHDAAVGGWRLVVGGWFGGDRLLSAQPLTTNRFVGRGLAKPLRLSGVEHAGFHWIVI